MLLALIKWLFPFFFFFFNNFGKKEYFEFTNFISSIFTQKIFVFPVH